MNLASKEDLLKGDVLQKELVKLSGGLEVYVREMTGTEKNIWERSMLKKVPPIGGSRNKQPEFETSLEDYRAKLAVSTICNEAGALLFTMREAKELGNKLSAANLEKIADVASRLNVITEEDQEELVKN